MKAKAVAVAIARDPEKGLAEVAAAIEQCDGNVCRAAHLLNYERRYFYKFIWKHGDTLWPVIDRARERALEKLAARRRMLNLEPNP